jgi:hypothetical protein
MPHEPIPIGPSDALGSGGNDTVGSGSPGWLVGCADVPLPEESDPPVVEPVLSDPVAVFGVTPSVGEVVVPGLVTPGTVTAPPGCWLVGSGVALQTGHGIGPNWSLGAECRHAHPASAWSAVARVIALSTTE